MSLQTATAAAAEELNPFKIAQQQFDTAANYLDLDDSMRQVLKNAKRQLVVSIPVTSGADRVLFDRGVFLLPDILANAGGVTVSYHEWVHDQYSYFWTEDRVRETLEQPMRTAFASVYAAAERFRTDMRTGAYVVAVGRVAEATSVRGIFP